MNRVRPSVKSSLIVFCTAFVALGATRADRYAVLLEGPPLAQQFTVAKFKNSKAALDVRAAINSSQASARAAIQQTGARITSANQLLVNALFVEATPEQAAQLRQMPGVALVDKLRPMKRHLNRALDLMNVPTAWGSLNGESNAGAGVKIAVLDSGIDQNHAAFQENGLQYPAGFPKGDSELHEPQSHRRPKLRQHARRNRPAVHSAGRSVSARPRWARYSGCDDRGRRPEYRPCRDDYRSGAQSVAR